MSIFSNAATEFFSSDMTVSALYIPKTGTSKSVNVIFDEDDVESSFEGGNFNNTQITIDVLSSDIPVVAQGDKFNIGTLDFQVIRTSPNQEGIITCECSKGVLHVLIPLEDDGTGLTVNGDLLMARVE